MERPEPTQLEHFSDDSFLGKLLVLPANVRLDWNVIARYKHSSLFGLIISNEGKRFYKIDTRYQCYKKFMDVLNKLECLPIACLSRLVYYLQVRPEPT
jgi:hypothetical protein